MPYARRVVVMLVTVAVGLALVVAQRDGAPAGASAGCGTASLHGVYALAGSGLFHGVPEASVGTVTFDGAGRVEGVHTDNAGGAVVRSTLRGTYGVDAGCRGTATFGHVHEHQVDDRWVENLLDEHVIELAVSAAGAKVAWLLVDTYPPGSSARPRLPEPGLVLSGTFERS